MTSRIEAVAGIHWIEALCQTREISEYMLYGYFVQNDVRFSREHTPIENNSCVSYWERSQLAPDRR